MQKLTLTTNYSIFTQGLPALYAIAFLSGISNGLFNPLILTFMAQHQVDKVWIGLNSTLYFLAIALGLPLVPKLLSKIGLRRSMMIGLILMSCSASLFPFTTQLPLWFAIRIFMGIAACLYLVCGQAGLNYFCGDRNRAIVGGVHSLSSSLGFGIGPIIGTSCYRVSPQLAFALGGALIFSGIFVVWLGLPDQTITFYPLQTLQILKKLILPLGSDKVTKEVVV